MNTDEPITTAIDQYLSHHQIREDIPDDYQGMMKQEFGYDWEKRFWNTKDKLLKLQRDCKEVDHNLVSWGEVNTLDDIIITIGVYEIEPFPTEHKYIWKKKLQKDPTLPPLIGQRWYNYLGEPFPVGALGKVVVLLSEEGVLFANEIARRIYDERLKNYRR
jgi:hypothetical protein